MFFLAVLAAFAVGLVPASVQQVRLLVPRADSPTAMVKCGAELEQVKAEIGAAQQYVFTGQEILSGMQYCVPEAGNEVHTSPSVYRVPAGTIGWLGPDGRVVLEQCVNQARCQGCQPPTPPTPVAVEPEPFFIPVRQPLELGELQHLDLSTPRFIAVWQVAEIPGLYIVEVVDHGKRRLIPCWNWPVGKWSPLLCAGAAIGGYAIAAAGGGAALIKPATAAAGLGILP